MGDHGGLVRTSGQQLASRRPPPPRGPSSRSRTETDRTDRSNKRAASFLFLSPGARGKKRASSTCLDFLSGPKADGARESAHRSDIWRARAAACEEQPGRKTAGGRALLARGPLAGEGPGVPFEHLVFDAEVTAAAPPLRSHFSGVPPSVRSVRSSRGRRGQDTTPSNARRRSLFADPAHRAFPTRSLKPSGTGGGGKTARGKTRDENRRRENQTTQNRADRRREEQEQLGQDQEGGGQESSRGTRQTDGSAVALPLDGELPASARELLAHSNNKAASPPPLTSAFVGGRQVRQHSACPAERRSVQRSGLLPCQSTRSGRAWTDPTQPGPPSVHLHPTAGLLTELTRRHSIPLCRTPPAKRPHKVPRCCSMWPS